MKKRPLRPGLFGGRAVFPGGRDRRVPPGALQRLWKLPERLPLWPDLSCAAAVWNLPLRRLL